MAVVSPPNRKQPRGGKEQRYAAVGSRGLSTALHRHVPTVPCRPAILRWSLRSPGTAVAEPTGSGTGTRRARPAAAAAGPCRLRTHMEQGLSMPGSAQLLHSPARGCAALCPSCGHQVWCPATERIAPPWGLSESSDVHERGGVGKAGRFAGKGKV